MLGHLRRAGAVGAAMAIWLTVGCAAPTGEGGGEPAARDSAAGAFADLLEAHRHAVLAGRDGSAEWRPVEQALAEMGYEIAAVDGRIDEASDRAALAHAIEGCIDGLSAGLCSWVLAQSGLDEDLIGTVLVSRAAIYAAAGLLEAADHDIERALDVRPEFDRALALRARLHVARGEPQRAVTELSAAAGAVEESPVALVQRGRANLELGDIGGAIRDFELALRLDRDFGAAYLYRAQAFAASDRADEALRDLEIASSLMPEDVRPWLLRGTVHAQIQYYERALWDFFEAHRLAPTDPRPRAARGRVYSGLGDFDRAIGELDLSLEIDPDYIPALLERGRAQFARGHNGEALEDLGKVMDLMPADPEPYLVRATIRTSENAFQAAVRDIDHAIALGADGADIRYFRAANNFSLGEFAGAAADFALATDTIGRPIAPVMAFIAARRAGLAEPASLPSTAASAFSRTVLAFWSGQLGPDQMLSAVDSLPPGLRIDAAAETLFHLSQFAIIAGDRRTAETFLNDILTLSQPGQLLYDWAAQDLGRI